MPVPQCENRIDSLGRADPADARLRSHEAGAGVDAPRGTQGREMRPLLLLIVFAGVISVVLYRVSANETAVGTEVQVAVRQLADGRMEFAIVHDGVFHYPRARTIPPSLDHQRWLRSTPVSIEVPLPRVGQGMLEEVFSQVEAACGRQLAFYEDWRPPDLLYLPEQAEAERDRVGEMRDGCRRQLNTALQALDFASLQDAIDPQTAEQYSISIDTTRLISEWTYLRMIDLIATHSLRS